MNSPALSKFAKCYIALLVALAATAWASSFSTWHGMSLRLAMFVILTLLSSRLKVRLPGVLGTLSVNYVFILLSAVSLPGMEVMIVALAGTLAQSMLGTQVRPAVAQVIFNVSAVSVCAFLCNHVYNWPALRSLDSSVPVMLFWTSICYFAFNTGTTAVILAITTQQRVHRVWYENYLWTAPHYLFGALLTSLLYACDRSFGWQYSVLVMPAVYFLYRSYNVYLNKIEEEKRHVTEMASLHLRTIETLALAIEAKDDTTHSHLRRVQIYALELAKEIGLNTNEIRALEAAALLHDIGKLAVPEYILNKPGRLTKEEFEKMKVHPVVGAEILECVQFPYPVAPIVRSHHEKWDGSGYPDGLKAEQIPIGARILSLVDVLDALASDRQYRPALPLDEALAYVTKLAEKEFDPKLVAILNANIQEYEKKVRGADSTSRLSTHVAISRGAAPAAGFLPAEAPAEVRKDAGSEVLSKIAAARQEVQLLHEMSRDLGASFSLADTLSLLAGRLKHLVPHDTMGVYCLRNEAVDAVHVAGVEAAFFHNLIIPLGAGLSGWVAENRRTIVNGNPAVEFGYLQDSTRFTTLRSALSVPLEGVSGVTGVMTLYSSKPDAFTQDDLRVLLAINSKIGLVIENAPTRYQPPAPSGTDSLTGLASATSLFYHVGNLIDSDEPFSVLTVDLDGFQDVNQRYGHPEGNRILNAASHKLRSFCRESDFIARMGGDEFALVWRGVDRIQAEIRARELADAAVVNGLPGGGAVHMSVGTASFPADGSTVEALLSEADRRMYQMKGVHRSHRVTLEQMAPVQTIM